MVRSLRSSVLQSWRLHGSHGILLIVQRCGDTSYQERCRGRYFEFLVQFYGRVCRLLDCGLLGWNGLACRIGGQLDRPRFHRLPSGNRDPWRCQFLDIFAVNNLIHSRYRLRLRYCGSYQYSNQGHKDRKEVLSCVDSFRSMFQRCALLYSVLLQLGLHLFRHR